MPHDEHRPPLGKQAADKASGQSVQSVLRLDWNASGRPGETRRALALSCLLDQRSPGGLVQNRPIRQGDQGTTRWGCDAFSWIPRTGIEADCRRMKPVDIGLPGCSAWPACHSISLSYLAYPDTLGRPPTQPHKHPSPRNTTGSFAGEWLGLPLPGMQSLEERRAATKDWTWGRPAGSMETPPVDHGLTRHGLEYSTPGGTNLD